MKRGFAALVLAAVLAAWAAPLVAAAQGSNSIVVRNLDLGSFPQVTISAQVVGSSVPQQSEFSVRENGQIISDIEVVPIGQTDTQIGIVLVIDVSGSMRTGGKLQAAKDAAKQFVAEKLANDQVAVVAFNDQPRVVAQFTSDPAVLNGAIDGLQATGETALFDAVRNAAALFGDRRELQPNIVLLSDGADTVSQNGVAEAEAAVLSAKAALFAVGLRGGEFDAASLNRLANNSGGQYSETTDARALSGLYQNVQRAIQNQYEINYTSSLPGGSIEITLAAAGAITTVGPVNAGAVVSGPTATPEVADKPPLAGLFDGTVGLVLVAAIACLAVGFFIWLFLTYSRSEDTTLAKTLSSYGPMPGDEGETSARGSGDVNLAQTAILKKAVEATAKVARERGVLQQVEAKLEQADLPVKAAEALFFYLVGVLALTVIGFLLSGPFGAFIAFFFSALIPIAVVNILAERRRRLFTAQLPDTLTLLASTLRAGSSLLQGADRVADQADDPMGKELRRVMVEARLGRPVELALEDSARRIRSNDYAWAVMAIRIQREVGGNLAELLQTVAETMLARERLRRDIRALTAEGRISAIVLGILPLAIGGAVWSLNPEYLDPLFHRGSGQLLLAGAAVVAIGGFIWMKKIVDIEV